MAEKSLLDRYRLLAATFRESTSCGALRERLGPGFTDALNLVVDALARDAAAMPREIDREKVTEMLASWLPGRLGGRETWAADVPDVLDAFLASIAEQESLSSGWEWATAIDDGRGVFLAALNDPDRPRFAGPKLSPNRRPAPKIGRNDPCFCGSGRKYKQCCLKLLP